MLKLSPDCHCEPYFIHIERAGPKRGSKGKIILFHTMEIEKIQADYTSGDKMQKEIGMFYVKTDGFFTV